MTAASSDFSFNDWWCRSYLFVLIIIFMSRSEQVAIGQLLDGLPSTVVHSFSHSSPTASFKETSDIFHLFDFASENVALCYTSTHMSEKNFL